MNTQAAFRRLDHGATYRRRWSRLRLLGASAATTILAACGAASNKPIVFPSDRVELVAACAVQGGMAPTTTLVMTPPELLVYSDGTVVAAAHRTIKLTTQELSDLIGQLRSDLRGLDPAATSREARLVNDASSTVLAVRKADGTLQSVTAGALGIVHDYPRGLNEAADTLFALANRTSASGTPFTSDRVRLVLQRTTAGSGTVHPWPAGVAVPTVAKFGLPTADIDGTAAQAVVAKLPPDAWLDGNAWPVFRLPDGSLSMVAWRYIAPNEDMR